MSRASSNTRLRSASLEPGGGSNASSRSHSVVSASPRSASPEKEVALDNVVSIARPPAAVEKERRMLLTKIGSLQNAHASKDEKMEFMESHINELTEEIRRKTK